MKYPNRSARLFLTMILCCGTAQKMHAQADSTYLPLDSWVYEVVDRLVQRGVLPPAWMDLRPWPRSTLRQMLQEAHVPESPADVETLALLKRMVGDDPDTKPYVSVATRQRVTAVAGTALQDGYHFAQTSVNDQGRPIATGGNVFSGLTMRAGAGHLSFYADGELQRVGSSDSPLSLTAKTALAQADFTPQAAAGPHLGVLRGRLLEAYAVVPFRGNAITIGRQQLWWGPVRSGATLFSNNAEPIAMVRYDRTKPISMPGPLHWLGEARAQALVGRLGGAQFIHAEHQTFGEPGRSLSNQPWIHAEKLSFHPRPSFEFAVSRSVLFAGEGAPFTTRSFLKSFFSSGTGDEERDPGDRRAAFDASWTLPKMNGCLRVYADTFTDDEPFPLAYVKESAWITGFTLRCIPAASRWTLRAEGLVSPHRDILPGFYYFNVHYLSGYTQQRQLIGSWIGREGKGEQVWATWHASPRTTVDFSDRFMRADPEFLKGGSLHDVSATVHHITHDGQWEWQAQMQAERWRFPLLQQTSRFNVVATGQIVWHSLQP